MADLYSNMYSESGDVGSKLILDDIQNTIDGYNEGILQLSGNLRSYDNDNIRNTILDAYNDLGEKYGADFYEAVSFGADYGGGESYIIDWSALSDSYSEQEIIAIKNEWEQRVFGILNDTKNNLEYEYSQTLSDYSSTWSSFITNLNSAMHSQNGYMELSDSGKLAADNFVNGLSDELYTQIDKNDPYEFVRKNFFDKIASIPDNKKEDFYNTFNTLFANDNLSQEDFNKLTNKLSSEYKINLNNFKKISDISKEIQLAQDSINRIGKSQSDYKMLDDFIKTLSIDELQRWNQITQNINNARDAIDAYNQEMILISSSTELDKLKLSTIFSAEDNNQIDLYQSRISKLKEALSSISNCNYSTSNVTDLIQELTSDELGFDIVAEQVKKATKS